MWVIGRWLEAGCGGDHGEGNGDGHSIFECERDGKGDGHSMAAAGEGKRKNVIADRESNIFARSI